MIVTPLAATWPFVPPTLGPNEVHLLTIRLGADAEALQELAASLSPDELARANRFRYERDRNRFIAAHARLRQLLAVYTKIPPLQLSFTLGPNDKPALTDAGSAPGLQFNLSHSGDRALVGIVVGPDIGVDIEEQREMPDFESVARRHFAPAEFERWIAIPAAHRADAFFCCWTRKEAYVKAVGAGLSMDLSGFEVSIDPALPARLISIGGSIQAASSWTLWGCEFAPMFRAAVAVNAAGLALRCFEGL
jgi:4'-phosphopantetheinyl transferase